MATFKPVSDDPIDLFENLLAYVAKHAVGVLEREGLPTNELDWQWGNYQDRVDEMARAGRPLPQHAMRSLIFIQDIRERFSTRSVRRLIAGRFAKHVRSSLAGLCYLAIQLESDTVRRSTMGQLRALTRFKPRDADERRQIEREIENAIVLGIYAGLEKMSLNFASAGVLDVVAMAVRGELDIVPRRAHDRVIAQEKRDRREISTDPETLSTVRDERSSALVDQLLKDDVKKKVRAILREDMKNATPSQRRRLKIGVEAWLSDESKTELAARHGVDAKTLYNYRATVLELLRHKLADH